MNCGEEHASRVCPKPPVGFSDRKCFNCNQSGHLSQDRPSRQQLLKALEDGFASGISNGRFNGYFLVDEAPGLEEAINYAEAPSALKRMHRASRRCSRICG